MNIYSLRWIFVPQDEHLSLRYILDGQLSLKWTFIYNNELLLNINLLKVIFRIELFMELNIVLDKVIANNHQTS